VETVKYKIGDVARMLGISTDLLRYYEKKGVVHPQKDARNDYRYYEAWDINFLIDCLWFKNFNFTIEEIAHMVSGSDYDQLSGKLKDKEEELDKALRRQQLLLERLRIQRIEMKRGREKLGKCDVVMSREVICYMNRHNFAYDDDPALNGLSQAWLRYMPFVRRCFEIRLNDLPGKDGAGNFSWGMSLDPKYGNEFPVLCQPPVKYLEPKRCVHTVFKSTGKGAFSPEHLRPLMDYAEEHGLTVCDNAYGNLLFSVAEDGGQTGYFEVWVPISEGLPDENKEENVS
jgi:DNA-binding transcriptional MerR regulator